jgi:hypothetical protein
MKRKVTRKSKAVRPKRAAAGKTQRKTGKPAASAATAADDIGALIDASAKALKLPLDPGWHAAITFNLQLILRHAALVEAFALPDDAEPAPIFHA